jgi:TolB-like protein
MICKKATRTCVLALILGLSRPLTAAQPAQKPPASAPATQPQLTVAVLDFQASMPGNPELGQQLSETLTAALSGEPGYSLVDRSSLGHTLTEHELTMSGLVSTDQAAKIGKLVGAKILVTGKVFQLDKQIFITAKLIGVETSLVDGIVIKGEKDAEIGTLAMQLAERLAKRIPEAGPKLTASDAAVFDPVPGLKKKLEGRVLPKVSVHVIERHVAEIRAARVDPAVETEIRQLLLQCGFTVVDGDATDDAKAGVTVAITGEAFSEFGARIGTLFSCTDRVEVKVTNLADKTLRISDRDNNRAVDLSENLAAKTALQKSGRALGIRILEHFVETLPAK